MKGKGQQIFPGNFMSQYIYNTIFQKYNFYIEINYLLKMGTLTKGLPQSNMKVGTTGEIKNPRDLFNALQKVEGTWYNH